MAHQQVNIIYLICVFLLNGCGYTILKPGDPSGQDQVNLTSNTDAERYTSKHMLDSILISEWRGSGQCADHMIDFGGSSFDVVFLLDRTWSLESKGLSIRGVWYSSLSNGTYNVILRPTNYPQMQSGSCDLSAEDTQLIMMLDGPAQISCHIELRREAIPRLQLY